jgi:hypothetical protein
MRTITRHFDVERGARWVCVCDCGRQCSVLGYNLRNGHTRSCGGCGKSAKDSNGMYCRTHGASDTLEYNTWNNMIQRCKSANSETRPHHAGRGIKVCVRWLSFANFLEDMGPRPSIKHQLDRYPNQDGDYEPGNCRWATPTEQLRNTSRNRILEFRGESHCVSEWAAILGINRSVVFSRLAIGWSVERALSTPVRRSAKRK